MPRPANFTNLHKQVHRQSFQHNLADCPLDASALPGAVPPLASRAPASRSFLGSGCLPGQRRKIPSSAEFSRSFGGMQLSLLRWRAALWDHRPLVGVSPGSASAEFSGIKTECAAAPPNTLWLCPGPALQGHAWEILMEIQAAARSSLRQLIV